MSPQQAQALIAYFNRAMACNVPPGSMQEAQLLTIAFRAIEGVAAGTIACEMKQIAAQDANF